MAPSTSTTMMLAMGDALALVVSRKKNFTPQKFAILHPGGSLGAGEERRRESRETMASTALKKRLSELSFEGLETRFLNRDAMLSMLNFGKGFDTEVEVSDERNLSVFYYYRDGDWGRF